METTIENRILYEDNHLIIINKLAGEIAQGDKTGDEPLLEKVRAYLKKRYQKPGNVFCGLVHRLDRPVSGCIVFAKTSKGLERMNALVKNREFSKIYWAIVEGKPEIEEQRLTHYLQRNEKLNKSFVSATEKKDSQKAELNYRTLWVGDHYSLLEVTLHTGRHHQIRAQLSFIGLPIKGDLKYGAKRSNAGGNISLHARQIAFIHPVTKKEITVLAPPPTSEKLMVHGLTSEE